MKNDTDFMTVLSRFENVMSFVKDIDKFEDLNYRVMKMNECLERFTSIDEMIKYIEKLEQCVFFSKDIFSVAEAAAYLHVSKPQIYKLTSENTLPSYKPNGKMMYFAKEDLNEWVMTNGLVARTSDIVHDVINAKDFKKSACRGSK